MRFIGIDALSGKDYGVEKVLAGELDATFIYPTGGDRVMQIAMDILNKRDFPVKLSWALPSSTATMLSS